MATGRDDVDRILAAVDRAQAALAGDPGRPAGPHRADPGPDGASASRDYGPRSTPTPSWTTRCPGSWAGTARAGTSCSPRTPPSCARPAGSSAASGCSPSTRAGSRSGRSRTSPCSTCRGTTRSSRRPGPLSRYLLGPKQPWQLADANWSPDFPTSAQEAVRLYRNEGGAGPIDGVLGITTYTIDAAAEGHRAGHGPRLRRDHRRAARPRSRCSRTPASPRTRAPIASSSCPRSRTSCSPPCSPCRPPRWTDLAATRRRLQRRPPAARVVRGPGRGAGGDREARLRRRHPPGSRATTSTRWTRTCRRCPSSTPSRTARWTSTSSWTRTATRTTRSRRAGPTASSRDAAQALSRAADAREADARWACTSGCTCPSGAGSRRSRAGTNPALTAPSDMATRAAGWSSPTTSGSRPDPRTSSYRWISPYPRTSARTAWPPTGSRSRAARPARRAAPLRITLPTGRQRSSTPAPGSTISGDTATVDTTFDRDIVVVVRYRPAPETP